MKDNIVEVKGLEKKYNNFTAVKNISFSIKKGEILALLGPNGAGKTTTLECLEGILYITEGEILVDGLNIKTNQSKIRKIMGIQLQSSSLPPTMTVEECLDLFCSYHNVNPSEELFKRFQLEELKKKCYGQLSVGQQRRVVLAIAVAHKPKLLILDEPTAGLDVVSRVELHKIIEELKNDDTSILLASHDMAEVEKLADKVVVLLKGEIVKEGTPEEISQSMNKLTKIAIRTEEPIDNYKNINVNLKKLNESSNYYEVYSEDINKMLFELVNYVNKNNNKIIDLKVERPNLEETFIKLTKIGV